jgi:uncharacterized protein
MPKFQWDEAKRLQNISKHKLDFKDSLPVFIDKRSLIRPSPRSGEERQIIVGQLERKIITIVYVMRDETIRLISMRAARKEEKELWLKNIL